MNTRQKMVGLAALPLAGLLATGGVALAQTTGTPASTQVVQQAATRTAGVPCPQHAIRTAAQQACDQQRLQDRGGDHGTCGDHQQARMADRTMDQHRDGSHADQADR